MFGRDPRLHELLAPPGRAAGRGYAGSQKRRSRRTIGGDVVPVRGDAARGLHRAREARQQVRVVEAGAELRLEEGAHDSRSRSIWAARTTTQHAIAISRGSRPLRQHPRVPRRPAGFVPVRAQLREDRLDGHAGSCSSTRCSPAGASPPPRPGRRSSEEREPVAAAGRGAARDQVGDRGRVLRAHAQRVSTESTATMRRFSRETARAGRGGWCSARRRRACARGSRAAPGVALISTVA